MSAPTSSIIIASSIAVVGALISLTLCIILVRLTIRSQLDSPDTEKAEMNLDSTLPVNSNNKLPAPVGESCESIATTYSFQKFTENIAGQHTTEKLESKFKARGLNLPSSVEIHSIDDEHVYEPNMIVKDKPVARFPSVVGIINADGNVVLNATETSTKVDNLSRNVSSSSDQSGLEITINNHG